VLDYSTEETNVDIEFLSDQEDSEQENFGKDVKIYRSKELANMSDKAYRIFISTGVKFPPINFIFKCREILGSQFEFYFNSKGKYFIS